MSEIKVSYIMVDKDTGGFTTGIGVSRVYTEKEFQEGKHKELTICCPLLFGCHWVYRWEYTITKVPAAPAEEKGVLSFKKS